MALRMIQQEIGVNQDWLDEWIAYRKEDKGKPLTPRALKMTIKWLKKYSEQEQQRLICVAIMNCWEGLHYVEPPKQNEARNRDLATMLTDTRWAE